MTEFDPAPEHTKPAPSAKGRYIAFGLAALLLVGLLIFAITRGNQPVATPSGNASFSMSTNTSPTETLEPFASTSATAAAATSSADPVPANPAHAECTTVTEGFVPKRFQIASLSGVEPVVSLNLDEDGNIAAPPKNEPNMASWWNAGPQPGSDAGKALLSIHTYRNGGALGNKMYEGGTSQLKPGDVIKLYGDDGQVMCYEFTEAKKVFVKDYDPESDVMVDFDGDPQLAIIICWDFDRPTEHWDSRVFFYATPVTAA